MGLAPYQRRYQRARPADQAAAPDDQRNPASHLTDQGADPDPVDLAWRIRRHWRVIYYCARYAAGLPLWDGADDFEIVMTDVLWRLSSAFEPIVPHADAEADEPEQVPADRREHRIYQRSCRVFRTPRFHQRERPD